MGDSTPTPPRCPHAARRRPRCSISTGDVRKLTPDKDETARGIALRIGRADRLTSLTPPASAITYTWDDNGNLTDRGSDEFEWDYEDRMVSATVDSAETTFAYRGDGLRESRTFNSNTITFTWDIAAGLPVVIDDEDARYVYGAGLVSQVTSGETYYYLADGLGSTMVTVDSDRDVVNSYTYDVFGETRSESGAQANECQFAGQQVDGSTGLQYLRARYYDMDTGRFISREPLMAMPGSGDNAYAYVAGNSVRLNDPTGLEGGEQYVGGSSWRLVPPEFGIGVWLQTVDPAGAYNIQLCVPSNHPAVNFECNDPMFKKPIQLLQGEVCTLSDSTDSQGRTVVRADCTKNGMKTKTITQGFYSAGIVERVGKWVVERCGDNLHRCSGLVARFANLVRRFTPKDSPFLDPIGWMDALCETHPEYIPIFCPWR